MSYKYLFLVLLIIITLALIFSSVLSDQSVYVNKRANFLQRTTKRNTYFNENDIEIIRSQLVLDPREPFIEKNTFLVQTETNYFNGHLLRIQVPYLSVHVYEAHRSNGGCSNNQLANVEQTANENECVLAINAGYFNQHNGKCLGSI
jgi:exopolysaccharide biosynthesis protein